MRITGFLPLLFIASAAQADICGIEAELDRQKKALGKTLSVASRDVALFNDLGIPTRKALFGHSVRTEEVMAYLSAQGCDETVVSYVIRKARRADSDRGGSGGGSEKPGGGDD